MVSLEHYCLRLPRCLLARHPSKKTGDADHFDCRRTDSATAHQAEADLHFLAESHPEIHLELNPSAPNHRLGSVQTTPERHRLSIPLRPVPARPHLSHHPHGPSGRCDHSAGPSDQIAAADQIAPIACRARRSFRLTSRTLILASHRIHFRSHYRTGLVGDSLSQILRLLPSHSELRLPVFESHLPTVAVRVAEIPLRCPVPNPPRSQFPSEAAQSPCERPVRLPATATTCRDPPETRSLPELPQASNLSIHAACRTACSTTTARFVPLAQSSASFDRRLD